MVEKCDFSYDLKRRFEACRRFGKMNYYAAYAFLIVAAAASAAATISIATELLPKYVNAVLAALPGIAYLINRHFRFSEKSEWWFEKFYIIEALHRGLIREGRNEKDISKELTAASLELNGRWPGFGEAPSS